MPVQTKTLIVAGVDVGGLRKGFHAVALRDGAYLDQFASLHAAEVAVWCRQISACIIGVDAPCRWSTSGRARTAERELMAEKIWCFSTPSRETAETHPKDYYRWMLNGAELFALLEATHALLDSNFRPTPRLVSFETFPQAVACALVGKIVSAKQKRPIRRALLNREKIDTSKLTNIDMLDAGLCAVAAHQFARGNFKCYGDAMSGLIVVPGSPLGRSLLGGDL